MKKNRKKASIKKKIIFAIKKNFFWGASKLEYSYLSTKQVRYMHE